MPSVVEKKSVYTTFIATPGPGATDADQKLVEEFTEELASTVSRLEQLLGIDCLNTSKQFNVFKKIVNRILSDYTKADGSWFSPYFALLTFCRDLEYLKREEIKTKYNKVRRRLIEMMTSTSWYGLRTELRVFGSLLKAKIGFEITDAPDVTLTEEFAGFYIEVTSCIFSKQVVDKSPLYKIDAAIKTKRSKRYANKQTILVIDVTDIMRYLKQGEIFDISSMAKKYASEETVFGAIVFFVTSVTGSSSMEHQSYQVCDGSSEQLKNFLSLWLPSDENGPQILECDPGHIMNGN